MAALLAGLVALVLGLQLGYRMGRRSTAPRPWETMTPTPGRWWRAVDAQGDIWCESSSEAEVLAAARPGDRIECLYTRTHHEWRTVPDLPDSGRRA